MTVQRVDWFRRDPTGGTVYARPVSMAEAVQIATDVLVDAEERRERLAVTEAGEPSSQAYVHECPDGGGAHMAITLSNGPPGHVYPPSVILPSACVLCGVDPLLLRATTPEHLAELDADSLLDEVDPPDLSEPDTSRPYFLDLIGRIDAATGDRS